MKERSNSDLHTQPYTGTYRHTQPYMGTYRCTLNIKGEKVSLIRIYKRVNKRSGERGWVSVADTDWNGALGPRAPNHKTTVEELPVRSPP